MEGMPILMGSSQDEDGQAQTVEDALENKAAREKEERRLPPPIAIMEPILRFLQLLCENHNRDLQVHISDLSSHFRLVRIFIH